MSTASLHTRRRSTERFHGFPPLAAPGDDGRYRARRRTQRRRPGGTGEISYRAPLAALLAASALVFAGCTASPSAPPGPEATSGIFDPPPADDRDVDVDAEVPEECLTVSVGWYPGVDIANVENLPGAWPQPPDGSTLCSTAGGAGIETAAYASPLSIDEIFAHYESQLGGSYTTSRTTGAENGTGYETLDGEVDGIGFQIRRNDGGFTVAFAQS